MYNGFFKFLHSQVLSLSDLVDYWCVMIVSYKQEQEQHIKGLGILMGYSSLFINGRLMTYEVHHSHKY